MISESATLQAAAPGRSIRFKVAITLLAYGTVAALTCLLAPLVGSTTISLWRVFDRSVPFADNIDAQIFFVARMPRVLTGAIVGAAFASAGVVLQALLRNPLATPFTLGVSAGAALGAMLAIAFYAFNRREARQGFEVKTDAGGTPPTALREKETNHG